MTSIPQTSSMTPTLEELGTALLRNITEQRSLHDRMRSLLREKREAIRTADFRALSALVAAERDVATAITAREQQRLSLLEQAQPWFGHPDNATVSLIADRISDDDGTALRDAATSLRESLTQLRAESTVLRDAATRLSEHLGGLVQTVQAAMSRAKVYGRTGQLALNATVDASLDLKT